MNAADPVQDPELRAIEIEARAIEGDQAAAVNPPDPDAPPAPEPLDPVQEARDLLDFAYDSLTPIYPSLEKVYTPAVRDRIARSGGKLLAKYGVSLADIFGAWGEEIAFAMVVLPLVVPTVQAIRADREAAAAPAPAKPAQPPANAPEQPRFEEPPAGDNPLGRFGQ